MPTRSEWLKVRVSDVELADLKARSAAAGLSLSDWIRFKLEEPAAPDVSSIQSKPLVAPNVSVSVDVKKAGTPRSSRFESERPRAGRRTMMCAHRVPVTAFCALCD